MEADFDEDYVVPSDNYQLFFQMHFPWPCLSFDVVPDGKGSRRYQFPHEATFVSATQADEGAEDNSLIVTRITELRSTHMDDEIEDDSQLPDPVIRPVATPTQAPCLRIRCHKNHANYVGSYFEDGHVLIYDISQALRDDVYSSESAQLIVAADFEIQSDLGFGLCWHPVETTIAVGQGNGVVSLWDLEGNCRSYQGHNPAVSVEDISFHPEGNTLLTCSTVTAPEDKAILIWDLRGNAEAISFTGFKCDVNVIDWNTVQQNLIVAGDDEGYIKIWDIRNPTSPIATLDYLATGNESSITSIEWNPNNEAEFAAACADGRVTIWDLGVEADEPTAKPKRPRNPEEEDEEEDIQFPDNLMFEHTTCLDPKEIHYHRQIPSMLAVTGDTFDVFIPDIQELDDDQPM